MIKKQFLGKKQRVNGNNQNIKKLNKMAYIVFIFFPDNNSQKSPFFLFTDREIKGEFTR